MPSARKRRNGGRVGNRTRSSEERQRREDEMSKPRLTSGELNDGWRYVTARRVTLRVMPAQRERKIEERAGVRKVPSIRGKRRRGV